MLNVRIFIVKIDLLIKCYLQFETVTSVLKQIFTLRIKNQHQHSSSGFLYFSSSGEEKRRKIIIIHTNI